MERIMPATKRRPRAAKLPKPSELALSPGAAPTIELAPSEWAVLVQLISMYCRSQTLEPYWVDLPSTCDRIKRALPADLSPGTPPLPIAAVAAAWHGAAVICCRMACDQRLDRRARDAAVRVGHAITIQLSAQTIGVR
jgi:hypothetical protein